MNKKLVASITTALVVGAFGTVFAGTPEDSFKDVPVDHWAYGAVQKLAADGILEGYSTQEFKGDRTLTRYELSMVVARAIDQYEKANDADKETIDKLSAEFASELNRLGKRVATVEKKTNSWISGDSRMRFIGNDPQSEKAKLKGGNQFDFRHRITWQGNIDANIDFKGRLQITQQFGKGANTNNANVKMDLGSITFKDTFGIDKIRVGRSELDSIGHGLIGKAHSNDGILVQKKVNDTTFKAYTGAIEQESGAATASAENTQQLTTVEVGKNFTDDFGMSAGYYWSDRERRGTTTAASGNLNIASDGQILFSSAKGLDVGFVYKMGKYKLFGDYVVSDLRDVKDSRISSNPKGWSVQLTNGVGPAVYYPAVALVDKNKPGTDAWMISYRSIDTGALPIGGFDTHTGASATAPFTSCWASDNVNAIYLAYQKVLRKNLVFSLEYQDIKFKDKSLTGLSDKQMDKAYKAQLQFWY